MRQVASRMILWARPYLELDDLIAIGAEALLRASARYDASRGVPFGSFAYLRVRGAMWEGIGAVGPLSRGMTRRRRGRPERHGPPGVLRFDDRHTGGSGSGSGGPSSVVDQLTYTIEATRLAPRVTVALESLDERERQIILRHYFAGDTLDEIGRAMGRSRSWASRAHALALSRLRDALEPGQAAEEASCA